MSILVLMTFKPYSRDRLMLALRTYETTGSFRLTGEKLGVGKDTAWRMVKKARALGLNDAGIEDAANKMIDLMESSPNSDPLSLNEAPEDSIINDETVGSERVITAKGIRSLDGLLEAAGVDNDKWVVTKKVVNKWDAMSKGDEPGTSKTVEMFQVKAWLERRPGFFMQAVGPVHAIRRATPKSNDPQKTALIIPDSQHGFRRGKRGDLIPLHDRNACDVAVQAARLLHPDIIILLGDMLDFAGLSSFSKDPDLRFLIQPALIELHWMIQSIRLACPSSRIIYLEGNHEYRMRRALIDKVDELADLRPVNDLDGSASLSVDRLLSLNELDVEYIGEYGEYFWLFDSIKVHHGNVAKSRGGSTVASILTSANCSHIVGHIHRREHASRTIQSKPGSGVGPKKDRSIISAMSPGCLCSLERSIVPSRKGAPVLDWQHGLGLVTKTDREILMNMIPINDGVCVINGRVIEGDFQLSELKRATGFNF